MPELRRILRAVVLGIAGGLAATTALAAPDPSFRFVETRRSKKVCDGAPGDACDYPLVGKFKLKATVRLAQGSGGPRFARSTAIDLTFGGISYAGTFGDDPKYRVGRRSARIPIATVENEATGKVKVLTVASVVWSTTSLSVTIAGRLPEEVVASLHEGEETGEISEVLTASLGIGSTCARFTVPITGTVETSEREIRDEDGDVVDLVYFSTIAVRGTGTPVEQTDQPPGVTISAPTTTVSYRPTVNVQARGTDDREVARMAYRLDGGAEVELTLGGIKPGTGAAAGCGEGRPATVAFDVDLGTMGTHTIEVVAYDSAGQATSATAEVTYDRLRITDVVGNFAIDARGIPWIFQPTADPVPMDGIDVATMCPSGHAIDTDGTVWRWHFVQRRWVAVPEFDSLDGIVSVIEGNGRTFAVTNAGEVWGFGFNEQGALGDGSLVSRQSIVRAQGLSGVSSLSQEWFGGTPLAITSAGNAYAWGYLTTEANQPGNPGAGGTYAYHRTPATLTDVPQVADVRFNDSMMLAAAADGSVRVGGYGRTSYPGDGRAEYWDVATWGAFPNQSWNPVLTLASPTGAKRVFVTTNLRFVVAGEDRQLWVWGYGYDGEIGDGVGPPIYSEDAKLSPYLISGMTGVVDLCSDNGISVLKEDGTVWCWGRVADRRQDLFTSGDPGTIPLVPVKVEGLPSIEKIGSMGSSAFDRWALAADGTLWKWSMGRRTYLPEEIRFVP